MTMRVLLGGIAAIAICHAPATYGQPPDAADGDVEKGKQVYERWCAPCHGPGIGLPGFDALPGTQQLAIKYRNTDIPAVLDQRTDLVPEYVEAIVRQGVSFMPQFRKTEVNDADLRMLAAYLTRNNPDSR